MTNSFLFEGKDIDGEPIHVMCNGPMSFDEVIEYAYDILTCYDGGHMNVYDGNHNFLFDVEVNVSTNILDMI